MDQFTNCNNNDSLYSAPILAVLCAFAACLAGEVFCYSIVAFGVYYLGTNRINSFRTQNVTKIVSSMLSFITTGRDKRCRVLSINKALNKIDRSNASRLCQYIDETLINGGYVALTKIKYKDMRQNCNHPKDASLFKRIRGIIKKIHKEYHSDLQSGDCIDQFAYLLLYLAILSVLTIFGPILLISKLLQIAYPWIIVGYLAYNDILFSNEIHLFQLVMLAIYVGLQLIIFLLGVKVFRIHHWLWHINCGQNHSYWASIDANRFIEEMHKFYHNVCWYPQAEKIVLRVMGNDIGPIVMEYCKNIQLSDTWLP